METSGNKKTETGKRVVLFIAAGLMLFIIPGLHISAGAGINGEDLLFEIDSPIIYGEDSFRERIEQRTGKERPAVGLVLSGGSARAFAHIGVLEFLEEQGIVPDFIVSNSMGSIVGLLYGAGFSPDQIYRLLRAGEDSSLFTISIPFYGGLLDTSGFLNLIALAADDLRLEDLFIPVLVTGEDLKTKRQIQMAEGDFFTVLQASYALPVYFDPVVYKDHLIIDGGFTNLVPLKEAAEFSDVILVATAFYQNPDLDLQNPLTILNVAVDISKARRGIEQLKEYDHTLIRSGVEHFSFMEFDRIDEIRQAGYESAEAQFSMVTFPLEAYVQAGELGICEELAALREQNEKRLSQVSSSLGRDGEIPARQFSWMLTPSITVLFDPAYRQYLAEDILFSLDFRTFYRSFQGAISAGTAWDLDAGSFYPVVSADLSAFWGPHIRAEGGGRLQIGDSVYAYGSIEGMIRILPEFSVFAGGGIESRWDNTGENERSAVTTWGGISADLGEFGAYKGEGGFQIREFSHRHLFYDGSMHLTLADHIRLSHRYLGKRSIDSSEVPMYRRDNVLLSSRKSDDAVSYHTFRAGYEFTEFRPTIGEVIIVKNLYSGVFAETDFSARSAWAAGITLGADVSFIGLEEISLFTDLGYDFFGSEFTGSVYVRK